MKRNKFRFFQSVALRLQLPERSNDIRVDHRATRVLTNYWTIRFVRDRLSLSVSHNVDEVHEIAEIRTTGGCPMLPELRQCLISSNVCLDFINNARPLLQIA